MLKKIRRLINYVVTNNKVFKEYGIKFTKSNLISHTIVDGKKVSIYYMPNMNMLGMVFGAVVYDGFVHRMMVDNHYMNASDNLKDFIIAHESGHIHNKDYSNGYWRIVLKQLKAIMDGNIETAANATIALRQWEKEKAADAYANQTTNGIAALTELYYTIPTEEIRNRIVELVENRPL